jgi:ribosomal protein L32
MQADIQSILRSAWPAFERTHRVAGYVRRAVWWMVRCGTGELGTLVLRCPDGHWEERRGKSCRHRACVRCGYRRRRQWIDGWVQRLLPIAHYQMVFTLPSQLHPLWRANRGRLAELLFAVVRQRVLGMLGAPQCLGAQPGMLMALHTWSRALTLHPHIHCLISAGGLTASGQWRAAGESALLSREQLRELKERYRRSFLRAVLGEHASGRLRLPPGWGPAELERVVRQLEGIKWNVRIEPPYRHGVGLVLYLARYVCGAPVGKNRLQDFDGEAVTVVVGREATRPATIELSAEEFVQRLLEHVPVPGLRMLRSCGLYAANKRRQLALSRTLVVPTAAGTAASMRQSDEACLQHCPQCGKQLQAHDTAPPRRRPPTLERTRAAPLPALVLTPLTAAA